MRRNELTIVVSLAALAAIAGFWLVVLSPKRQQASDLKDEVAQLQSQVDEAKQSVAAGEQAKRSFPADYRKLVVLGKAVPADGDQASLLVQLQQLANRSKVRFQSIQLSGETASASSSTATTPPPTSDSSTTSSSTASTTSSSSSTTGSSTTGSSTSTQAPTTTANTTATPTEASAATLPIGASVGPAGLPVMPYDLTFTGNFFQIADFMKRLNGLVNLRGGAIDVRGRLVTVDAFTLQPVQSETDGLSPVPTLTADLTVTTYLTPAEQGLTGGATPSGPAPAAPTPVSSTTGSATSTPAAPSGASPPTASP